MGIIGPDHCRHRTADLLRGFLHTLQHRPTVTLASGLRDERQVQHANFIGAEIGGQRADGRVELLDHVMHGVGEVLPQPLFLHVELLDNHLLNHFLLTVDPLQIRPRRLVKAVQKRPIAGPRRPYHQAVRYH